MSDGRHGALVVGALTAITGGVLFLAAGRVITLPDEMFGSPRWLVALFAWFVAVRWLIRRPAP